jgi:hypothetical protein
MPREFSMATKDDAPPVGDFQILVMDNVAPDQSSAAWTDNSSLDSEDNAPYANLTTTKINSRVFGVCDNWDNSQTSAPGSGQAIQSIVLNAADVDGYWVQTQNSPTPNLRGRVDSEPDAQLRGARPRSRRRSGRSRMYRGARYSGPGRRSTGSLRRCSSSGRWA